MPGGGVVLLALPAGISEDEDEDDYEEDQLEVAYSESVHTGTTGDIVEFNINVNADTIASENANLSADDNDNADVNENSNSNADDQINHSADIENGYVYVEPSTASEEIHFASISSYNVQLATDIAPEDLHSHEELPLLLCSTKREILLIDPSVKTQDAIIDIINNPMCRSAMPSLLDIIPFDRITFLEWIPDMGIALAGSLFGGVAVIELQTTVPISGQKPDRGLKLVAHLPEDEVDCQLCGVSVYRHPIDRQLFRAITVYITYIDGRVYAYELHCSDETDMSV
ncbi:hypothetical protein GGI07_004116 [Coemansia sp. Benny D115]|nr:hypothetical protein GGI07_004116 [Coemansia sp. Benny D115]